jgi:hypothetical protein
MIEDEQVIQFGRQYWRCIEPRTTSLCQIKVYMQGDSTRKAWSIHS